MQEILSKDDFLTLGEKFKILALLMYRIDFHPKSRTHICYIPELRCRTLKGYGDFAEDAYNNYIENIDKYLAEMPQKDIYWDHQALLKKRGPEVVHIDKCIEV